jgi:hypothetical protein
MVPIERLLAAIDFGGGLGICWDLQITPSCRDLSLLYLVH